MNNRRLTVFMLAWLFSHQLFAAVLSLSTSTTSCQSLNQSPCEIEAAEHIGHFMPVMSSPDSTVDDEDNLSIISDHCSSVCQSLLPNINSVMPLKVSHTTFATEPTTTAVKTSPQRLFRPPIIA